MQNKLKLLLSTLIFSLLFIGCGNNTNSNENKGVFIDDVVSGIKYINGNNEGYTNSQGEFPYENGTVEFYLGKIKIGEINSLNSDKKVFIQDIVGVDRTNTNDSRVLKIATFLQSLDSDDSTDTIEILDEDFNKFTEIQETSIDQITDINTTLIEKGFEVKSKDDVKRHLDNVLKLYDIVKYDNPTQDNNNLLIENINTNLGKTSSISVIFNEDIKKAQSIENFIKLFDENGEELEFTVTHKYDKLDITLEDTISSFQNIILEIEVSKLIGYGISGDKDVSINLSSYIVDGYSTDIQPPMLSTNSKFLNEFVSELSIYTFSGNVTDNSSLEKVFVKINDEEYEADITSNEYIVDVALEAGANKYSIVAIDINGNKSSITNTIFLGKTVAAGGSHSGAIKNGELFTWGRNNYGQTGLGYTSKLNDETNGVHPATPTKVETPTEFEVLSFMQNYSLAIDKNGDVYSWGYDKYGELGRGDVYTNEICGTTNCRLDIGKIEGLSNIVAIDAGLSHALALDKDGNVFAWGSNKDGELGSGSTEDSLAQPVQVIFPQSNVRVVKVTAGSDFSVALDNNGEVWVWGKNFYGQAGQGFDYGTNDQLTPIKVPIPNGVKIKSIEAGTGHILALAKNGEVYGWGNNSTSQVGYNGYQYKGTENAWESRIYEPTKILDNDNENPVIGVYAGGNSSYIIRADKKVYPWGQFGETKEDGSQEYNNLDFPEDKLKAITSVKDMAAGALHVTAIKDDGVVFTWRWSFEGSLGGESIANIWFYLYPIIVDFPIDNTDSNPDSNNNNSITDLSGLPPAGGSATIAYNVEEPFLEIIDTLNENEISGVSQGRELFIAHWTPAPGSRPTLDGLGPLFNANACTSCHNSNGRVTPYNSDGTTDKSFLFRIADENGNEHPIYGGQLQTQATSGASEASISWTKNSLSNKIEFHTLAQNSLDGFNIGGRISPHLIGMGLLDLVTEETILEYEDVNDLNGDGISGRAHWVIEEGEQKIGRFGWKAINSSLKTQNAGAMHQDMGLTTSVNPNENCTSSQDICQNEANGGNPEVSEIALQQVVDFMSALGVPNRRVSDKEKFNKGLEVFERIGCASCHRPTMTTGTSNKFSSLSNQTIYAYTDLLLHDMGESLADGVREKNATGSEWRTPPLWGIGIVEAKEGARFLHDGRAASIKEAIELHDGEAKEVRNKFMNLDNKDLEDLLLFLRSI